jgi:DNA-binding transcriptional ArsR family regulator
MNIQTARARALDHTLAALADPTRRAILERLSRGDARVTDVAGPFAISLNSVSKHIRLLERAGLVHRLVVGREHHLSLDTGPLDDAAAWIERQRTLWQSRLRMLDAILQEEDRARPTLTAKNTKTKQIKEINQIKQIGQSRQSRESKKTRK